MPFSATTYPCKRKLHNRYLGLFIYPAEVSPRHHNHALKPLVLCYLYIRGSATSFVTILCSRCLHIFYNFKVVIMLGGKEEVDVQDTNSLEIDELANFAVSEHNAGQNSLERMSFSKVVSCHKQVVSGLMYHFVIEVEEGSQLKQYVAKVWVKPGGASRKMEEFKPVDGGLTSADMGVRTEGVPLTKISQHSCVPVGKQIVPTDDPIVQEAAEHAIKMLQQGSNSLSTYELREIMSAEAQLEDGYTLFDLLLKTKRGSKEENFKSEVHRAWDGAWSVKHATQQ